MNTRAISPGERHYRPQLHESERKKLRQETLNRIVNNKNKARCEHVLKQYDDILKYLSGVFEEVKLDTEHFVDAVLDEDDMLIFHDANELIKNARDKLQLKQNEFNKR